MYIHGQKLPVQCTLYIHGQKYPAQCTKYKHGQKRPVQCIDKARHTLYNVYIDTHGHTVIQCTMYIHGQNTLYSVQCTLTTRNTLYIQCTYTTRNSGVRTVITLLIFRQLVLCTNLRLRGTNKHFTHTNTYRQTIL